MYPAVDWGYAGVMPRFHLRSSAFVVASVFALCAWVLVAANCSSSRGIRLSGAGGSGTGGIDLGGSIASGGASGTGTGGVDSGGSSASGGTSGIATGGIDSGGSGGDGGTSTPDGGEATGSCLPGATQSDCQLCGPDLSGTCQRACPTVDCSVYPVPAECAAVCSGATCCECQLSFGNEHFWRSPQVPPQCGTACSDIVSKWTGYMADPGLTACTIASDCIVVGSTPSYCDCGKSVAGCGRAANATAYSASPAATLETQYRGSCTQGFDACDCGPGYPDCVNGTCTLTRWGCCMCLPADAGRF